MERLAPLFRTPRAVKRFVNTYRFLRAGVKPQYIGRFEGVRDDPGTYRGALALLAIVVSSSNIAPQFLDRLVRTLESGHGTLAWSRFLREARADVHSIGTGDADELKAKSNGAGARSAAKTREKRARGKKAETVARTWEEIEWVNLCDALSQVSGDDFPVREIRALEEWIPTVSRYSFSLSSAAALQRERV